MGELQDFKDYGFYLNKVAKEARENGLEELADEIEKAMFNVQICYDMVAQKWSVTAEKPWNLDVAELKARMKK